MKTTKNKKDIKFSFEKYQVDESTADFSAFLSDKFGKHGTKKREEFDKKVLAEYHANVVKDLRKKAGLTQQDIAEKLGMEKSYISRIESGKIIPSIVLYNQLISTLGFKIDFKPLLA